VGEKLGIAFSCLEKSDDGWERDCGRGGQVELLYFFIWSRSAENIAISSYW
jgi:hypothetical protein